ncbi:MAG: RNA polymerase subunit sigma-24 [Phycisphaerae bacterium]|nr:RNA polymerase subunit sigma-24 [Phycisphaerae bacterium]
MSVLQRVAAGDQSAFEECIDRFGGLVWSLARRQCRDRSEAEDAVQDVFISVWRSAGRYDARLGSESTFVATIARRRLIDRIRRKQRRPEQGQVSPEISEAIVADGGVEGSGERIERDEAALAAHEALRELSPDQQRVLRLSIMHGLSHEKIAESLDMPLGTVKTHIRRGMLKARKLIAERKAASDESSIGRDVEVSR